MLQFCLFSLLLWSCGAQATTDSSPSKVIKVDLWVPDRDRAMSRNIKVEPNEEYHLEFGKADRKFGKIRFVSSNPRLNLTFVPVKFHFGGGTCNPGCKADFLKCTQNALQVDGSRETTNDPSDHGIRKVFCGTVDAEMLKEMYLSSPQITIAFVLREQASETNNIFFKIFQQGTVTINQEQEYSADQFYLTNRGSREFKLTPAAEIFLMIDGFKHKNKGKATGEVTFTTGGDSDRSRESVEVTTSRAVLVAPLEYDVPGECSCLEKRDSIDRPDCEALLTVHSNSGSDEYKQYSYFCGTSLNDTKTIVSLDSIIINYTFPRPVNSVSIALFRVIEAIKIKEDESCTDKRHFDKRCVLPEGVFCINKALDCYDGRRCTNEDGIITCRTDDNSKVYHAIRSSLKFNLYETHINEVAYLYPGMSLNLKQKGVQSAPSQGDFAVRTPNKDYPLVFTQKLHKLRNRCPNVCRYDPHPQLFQDNCPNTLSVEAKWAAEIPLNKTTSLLCETYLPYRPSFERLSSKVNKKLPNYRTVYNFDKLPAAARIHLKFRSSDHRYKEHDVSNSNTEDE